MDGFDFSLVCTLSIYPMMRVRAFMIADGETSSKLWPPIHRTAYSRTLVDMKGFQIHDLRFTKSGSIRKVPIPVEGSPLKFSEIMPATEK